MGLEIFRQRVQPTTTLLEFLINDDVKMATHHLTAEKERQLFELVESEANPYSWDFDVCNIVLGNFNYKKMSLVRDYNQVIDNNIRHGVFEHLFSDQPKTYREETDDTEQPENWHHVITADPTQTKAILQARSGESYIIQGPPGTGKSQTITNLIADFIAQGKSVLFVCEKRAALDVVYHRLKQQHLDELCCYIHDSQSDKRAFIKNCKATYEDFIKNKPDLKLVEAQRSAVLEQMTGQLSILRSYHLTNAQADEHAGTEVRRLIERLIALKSHLVSLPVQDESLLPHYNVWKQFGETIIQLGNLLEESGAEASFADHPFSKINVNVFHAEAPVTFIEKLTTEAQRLLKEVSIACAIDLAGDEQWQQFQPLKSLLEDAVLLYPLAVSDNLKLAAADDPQAKHFDSDYRLFRTLQQQWKEAEERNKAWKEKFNEQDTLNALAVCKEHEGSLFGFFNSAWRQLKKNINQAYDFGAHMARPTYSAILENLRIAYELQSKVFAAESELASAYRLQNIDTAQLGIERIREEG